MTRSVRLEQGAIDRMKISAAQYNDGRPFDPAVHDVAMGRDGMWHIVPKPKRTVDARMRERSNRVISTLSDLQAAWDRRNAREQNDEAQ